MRRRYRSSQAAILCSVIALYCQTRIQAADADGPGNIRTKFVADAALSQEDLLSVVALAESRGIKHIASVETFHYLPSNNCGIRVTSLEHTNGRQVTFDTVEVFREGWAYKPNPTNTTSKGPFWVDQQAPPVTHELTMFGTPRGTVRVELASGVPIDVADRIIKAFNSGRIAYAGRYTQAECKSADFTRPNWLQKSNEAGLYEMSCSGGLNRYRFKLSGEEVEIVFVIHVAV